MTNIFTQTSDIPYDKYDYQVVHNNYKKVVFDNYYDMSQYWFVNSKNLNYVNILNKKSKSKGFKQ